MRKKLTVIGAAFAALFIAVAQIEPSGLTLTVSVKGNISATDKITLKAQIDEYNARQLELLGAERYTALTYTNAANMKASFEQIMSNRLNTAFLDYRAKAVSADAAEAAITKELMQATRQAMIDKVQSGIPPQAILDAIKALR